MRRIVGTGFLLTILLLIGLGVPTALAHGSYQHHPWCLQTGSGLECAYSTLRQCREAGSGATVLASCVRNTAAMNHR